MRAFWGRQRKRLGLDALVEEHQKGVDGGGPGDGEGASMGGSTGASIPAPPRQPGTNTVGGGENVGSKRAAPDTSYMKLVRGCTASNSLRVRVLNARTGCKTLDKGMRARYINES